MFKRNLKAVYAFVGTLSMGLSLIVTGNETVADVSQAEWIALVAGITALPLGVYGVGNSK